MSELKNIPEGWVETTLGKVTNYINRGITPKYSETDGIHVLNQRCIRNNRVSFQNARIHDIAKKNVTTEKIIQFEDILICSTGVGTLGRVGQVAEFEKPTTVDSHVTIVRANDNIDNLFLGFYLRSKEKEIEHLAEGSTGQTELPRKKLDFFSIIKPENLQEQKSIAAILKVFDDKIHLLHAQNITLDETAQTIFKEWFGKYQIGDELREGFTKVTLKEIIKSANTGLDAIKRAPIIEEKTGIKCFRIQDASQKKDYSNWGNTRVEQKNYERFKLIKGDILIARTGNSIGVNYLVKEDLNSVFNNGLIRLRVNSKSNYSFLYMTIISKMFERHIQSIAHGTSTQPNMQINALLSYEFILPPLDKQNSFEEILTTIFEKQKINQIQIQTLTNVLNQLLPRLMSGEIRLNEFKV